jgi:uncharacterized protein (DUF1015 family)
MITIRPFRGLRPPKDIASSVACKPYDVLNTEEARAEAEGNLRSFYHIDKPEIDLPEGTNLYSSEVYAKGRENLELFQQNGWLVRDKTPCLYVYAQEMNGRRQTGLVAGSWIDDYFEGRIKKHELTRPDKEKDRIAHMKALGAHPGKVFLAYKAVAEIDAIIDTVTKTRPVYDFTDTDKVKHQVWVIDHQKTIEQLVQLFGEKVPHTYIADGHHRAAASAKVGAALREENPGNTGEEPYNFFLSVLFPANQLHIMDYNRVVKDLNGQTSNKFLASLTTDIIVEHVGATPYIPQTSYEFGMYLNRQWYRLRARQHTYVPSDPILALDVNILSEYVLKPLLNIQDQRSSDRIDFVGGIRGLSELQRRVDSGEMAVAFALYPVSMQQLMDIADSGKIMPPKSTWFEPKLKSGLVVNLFDA